MLERHHPAVYRYLMTALRGANVAEEWFPQFAERFVRGDFKKLDPLKGRFRSAAVTHSAAEKLSKT